MKECRQNYCVIILRAEMGSASHKSCAASLRAAILKILRRKRFRKPKTIIARKRKHKRKCDVLKSIVLIDSLLKLR